MSMCSAWIVEPLAYDEVACLLCKALNAIFEEALLHDFFLIIFLGNRLQESTTVRRITFLQCVHPVIFVSYTKGSFTRTPKRVPLIELIA